MREIGTPLITVGVQSLDIVIRAELVREILGERTWVAIPGARHEVPGIVLWGGRAVGVIDLARFHSGLKQLGPEETRPRMLILQSGNVTLAVPADRVSEVWKTHQDNLQPRQLHEFSLARSEVVLDERALPLFEPELLLARLAIEA